MGLLDAAQAASNAAASTVSGPVDMLAWLLRKAGVNVGDPVGGSDWMKRKGLTKDVAPGVSQVAGETLGLLAPTAVATKAPQIAKGLLAAADNLAAPRTLNPQQGAIVWHGSPHKFDKFDSSKIGTGEGAQAYGHGLYLAESPDVAKEYQRKLGGFDVAFSGSPKRVDAPELAKRFIEAAEGDLTTAIARLQKNKVDDPALVKEAISIMRGATAKERGSLYKVDLPDNAIARMLDWDKPLSQQAQMIDVVRQARPGYMQMPPGQTKASDAYMALSDSVGHAKAAEMFRKSGIPGIRYLDGGSRGAGSGTSNFVVFPGEEGLLTILERNGVPLR